MRVLFDCQAFDFYIMQNDVLLPCVFVVYLRETLETDDDLESKPKMKNVPSRW